MLTSKQPFTGAYPQTRLRRLRSQEWCRRLVAENTLSTSDLIWPIFVVEGQNQRQPIATLPGVDRLSLDILPEAIQQAEGWGIPMVAIFPAIEASLKSDDAREAHNPDSLVCRAIKVAKQASTQVGVMCDIALDLYTPHGHDGLVRGDQVLNDETIEVLIKQSLTYAKAGCDVLGPSDMMDGRVGMIRQALEEANHTDINIFAYAAKYSSALYGPYRDAVQSSGQLAGASKATYQQNPANQAEALREVALDLQEGADAVIIKPGLFYLDIIHAVKETFQAPTIGYQVSGEYAMMMAAASAGYLDGPRILYEAALSMKRAGCDAIITYAAPQLAKQLLKES